MGDPVTSQSPDIGAPAQSDITVEVATGYWQRRADALWRETPDAVVAQAPDAGEAPLAVSGAGVYLWDLLAEPHAFDEIVTILADAHGVDADTVRSDVRGVLVALAEHHVVQRRP